MKKRILSLAICILMVTSTLTMASCSGKDSDDLLNVVYNNDSTTTSSNPPATICIYTITDGSTTDEAIKQVEKALSAISVKKYNTTIDLILLPEETYASVIFSKTESTVSAYRQWVFKNETPKTEEERLLNQNPELKKNNPNIKINIAPKVPTEVTKATLDIFLVYNPDSDSLTLDPKSEYYNEALVENGMFDVLYKARALAPLNDKLTGNFSTLKNNVPLNALDFVTRPNYKSLIKNESLSNTNKEIFGVPNNYIYGSYDYVLFNTECNGIKDLKLPTDKSFLFEETGGSEGETRLDKIIKELKDKVQPEFEAMLEAQGIPSEPNGRWNEQQVAEWKAEYDKAYEEACKVTIGVKNITKQIKSYEDYIQNGDDTFAIGYITGEASVKELFEANGVLDVYQTKANVLDDKLACESMFCISPATVYVDGNVDKTRIDRCLEVLMLINNDAEFRNILQYGVKDTHYTTLLDKTLSVTGTVANKYVMNPKWCGNMYLLQPADTMSAAMRIMAKDEWRLAKRQAMEMFE